MYSYTSPTQINLGFMGTINNKLSTLLQSRGVGKIATLLITGALFIKDPEVTFSVLLIGVGIFIIYKEGKNYYAS